MGYVPKVRGVNYLSGELDSAVLDLTDVTFIDSVGLRALVLLSKKASGGLVLRYPQDALLRVFELLQLDEMPGIRIEPGVDEGSCPVRRSAVPR